MANGHGGARPGAGRKKSETVVAQEARRAAFETEVSADDWRAIIRTAASQAKGGDPVARAWITPWIVGKVPDELKFSGRAVIEVVYSDSNSADPAVFAPATSGAAKDHR